MAKISSEKLNSKIPEGPLAEKWTNYKAHQKLVNPANKRNLDIIVVGTGLAGASAAASLGAMGFNVLNFCIQDHMVSGVHCRHLVGTTKFGSTVGVALVM